MHLRAYLILGACLTSGLMIGCAHGPLTSPSLAEVQTQSASIGKSIAAAQTSVNQALKDSADIARPALNMDLRGAQAQLAQASQTNAQQAADLTAKQKQIDQVTAQGNAAIAELAAQAPKRKRDAIAALIGWALCSGACIGGPLLMDGYPPLEFIPVSLRAIVCSLAAFIILSGIASLLALFGVL